jgi:L-rhamnose mutarotase
MRNLSRRFTLELLTLSFLFTGCAQQRVKRYGNVIGLRPEKLKEYKELHADVWPGVLKMIKECNIHNYSIYLGELEEGKYYLFSYFEYTGDDFKADMAIKNGGRSAILARLPYQLEKKVNGGPIWKKCFTVTNALLKTCKTCHSERSIAK